MKRKVSAKIYSNLAVLENALYRYDNAYAYAQQLLALSPYDKRGLLMKLHFATPLGNVGAARDVTSTLQQLDKQGKLATGEQQTLALYLRNEYVQNLVRAGLVSVEAAPLEPVPVQTVLGEPALEDFHRDSGQERSAWACGPAA